MKFRAAIALCCLALSACSPAKAPAPATPSVEATAASVKPANLTPFGKSAKVNDKALFTLTKVEVRGRVGVGNKARSAPDGKLYVIVEYLIQTPGIDAVAIEPVPEILLSDQNGQLYPGDQDLGGAYADDRGFSDRFDQAMDTPQHILDAAVFEVPASTFRRETWWAATGTDVKFAL